MERGEAILGGKYKDVISGFEGTAIAITEYLYACRRVSLSSLDKMGCVVDYTFDEEQLENQRGVVNAPHKKKASVKTGGTRPGPAGRSSVKLGGSRPYPTDQR